MREKMREIMSGITSGIMKEIMSRRVKTGKNSSVKSKRGTMIRKAGVLVLSAIMALSVMACSSKPKTVSDAITDLNSFEVNESNIDMAYSAESESRDVDFAAKLIFTNMKDNKYAMEIKYQVDGLVYETVSTMFFTKEGIYINARQALDFLSAQFPEYASLSAGTNLKKEYVLITQIELAKYLKSYNLDTALVGAVDSENMATNFKNVSKFLWDILKQTSEKMEQTFMTVEDGVLKINITSENTKEIMDIIANLDYAQYNKTLSTEKKDLYNAQLKTAFAKLTSETGIQENLPNIVMTAQTEGKIGKKIATITMDSESTNVNGEKATLKINLTSRQKAVSSYIVPSEGEASSLAELLALLSVGSTTK